MQDYYAHHRFFKEDKGDRIWKENLGNQKIS
jgi:hypothetical protein